MKSSMLLSALAALPLLLNGAENLLPNAGFETWSVRKNQSAPDEWNAEAGCAQDRAVFHGGQSSARIEPPNTKSYTRISRFNFPLNGARYCRLSAWVKGENIVSAVKPPASVILALVPGPKSDYWNDKVYLEMRSELQGSFDWRKLEQVFAIPAGMELGGVSIGLRSASGKLWVDDVTLEPMTDAEFLAAKKSAIRSRCPAATWRESYADDDRCRFSFYRAEGDKPAPVLVYIHGGGWLNGDGLDEADSGRLDGLIRPFNQAGISVAVVNYRLGRKLPIPVHDAARAIQFLRANAEKFGIDKTRFAAQGFSAGATTSLWLAAHPDLADPKSADPVARESSRVQGAILRGVQSSIDPEQIRAWGLEEALNHKMICSAGGFPTRKAMEAGYAREQALYREFSGVNFVGKETPPLRIYGGDLKSKDWIHHPKFAVELKKAADANAAPETTLVMPFEKQRDRNDLEFLKRIFNLKK